MEARRVVRGRRARWGLVWRRLWRGSVFSYVFAPLLFLAAMGIGLGDLVNKHQGGVQGFDYLEFITPGLMAASAVMQAAGESLWPVMGGVKWLARITPRCRRPSARRDVYLGQLSWTGVRTVMSATVFLAIAASARRRAVVLGRVRDPGDGARRAGDRGPAVRVGDRARERRRVRRRHAHRGVPAVPVLGDVLPGQPSPRLARAGGAAVAAVPRGRAVPRRDHRGRRQLGGRSSATSGAVRVHRVGRVVGARTFNRTLTQ